MQDSIATLISVPSNLELLSSENAHYRPRIFFDEDFKVSYEPSVLVKAKFGDGVYEALTIKINCQMIYIIH